MLAHAKGDKTLFNIPESENSRTPSIQNDRHPDSELKSLGTALPLSCTILTDSFSNTKDNIPLLIFKPNLEYSLIDTLLIQ